MTSDVVPDDELDREALLDRLRVAEKRLALAEAELALAQVTRAPAWKPANPTSAEVADRLDDLAPALDVLFHTAEVAMVLLSSDGVILRANNRAAELWGLPISEICGRRTIDMTAPEDRARTARALAAEGRGEFLMKTYLRADGTRVPALAMGWPLLDDDGREVCLIGVAVPTAEVRMTASTLREATDSHPRNQARAGASDGADQT